MKKIISYVVNCYHIKKKINESKKINNNFNRISNNNPQICFCRNGNNESYDYLINALK